MTQQGNQLSGASAQTRNAVQETRDKGLSVLRRWDYKRGDPSRKGALELASDGAAKVLENPWITLEDGIQIQFYSDYDGNKDADDAAGPSYYRTGQYWLIPARTATGERETDAVGDDHDPRGRLPRTA